MTLQLFQEAPRPVAGHKYRYYQEDAARDVLSGFEGSRSQLVVMATGLGKTEIGALVARDWPGDVLWLAHRDELIDQARERLQRLTGRYVELEKASSRSDGGRLVCGSVQSVCRENRLRRLGKGRFSLLIVDEAHHYTAKTYRRVLDFFGEAKILGLTATPDRGDEEALGSIFDGVPYCMDIEDGIEAGYLVPVTGREVNLQEIDLSGVSSKAGDLAEGELDEVMVKAVEGIVRETLRLEPMRQGIAFFPGVRSAEYAHRRFNEILPNSSCFISAHTDPEERRSLVAAYKAGHYRYLCNCQIATEGFDAPPASLIIQGRPTKSRALYAQMVGRGTRVLPGTVDHLHGRERATDRRAAVAASAKPDMVILDFVGNSGKHALATVEDVLGGNYTEEEVSEAKAAKKRLGENARNARELLAQARRALAERAKSIAAAKVRSTVRDFDPFQVFGIDMPDEARYTSRFGNAQPATEGQIEALRRAGVPDDELNQMTKRAASKLFQVIQGRRKHNLCTFKQLRILQKHGVTRKDVRYVRAGQAIDYIASVGWGNRKDSWGLPIRPDPARLDQILFGGRDAGED